MKKQNDSTKSKHYKVYTENKPTYVRNKEAIDTIPKRCWWVREYLKGIYRFPSQK